MSVMTSRRRAGELRQRIFDSGHSGKEWEFIRALLATAAWDWSEASVHNYGEGFGVGLELPGLMVRLTAKAVKEQ